MKIIVSQYREPSRPDYIYVDPITNTVHLLMPIVGGDGISTDNTCQSVQAHRKFFGEAYHLNENTALTQLTRYLDCLNYDIKLDLDPFITAQKIERKGQIQSYINALSAINRSNTFAIHGRSYPEWIKPFFTGTNLYSMHLRPLVLHPPLNFSSPVFSLERGRDYTEQPESNFVNALKQQVRQLDRRNPTPQELLKQRVLASLGVGEINFTRIQDTLAAEVLALFGVGVDFKFAVVGNRRTELTPGIVDAIMGFDELNAENYVDGLMGLCAPDLFNTLDVSPFALQASDNPAKRVILVQLFLAELNIYCNAHQLSTENFGAKLDGNIELSTEISLQVRAALINGDFNGDNGDFVEKALFDFINQHHRAFGLDAPLGLAIYNNVKASFTTHFRTIAKAPFFDEFTVLMDQPGGLAHSHQGGICVGIAEVVTKFKGLDNEFFQRVRGTELPHQVPGTNGFVNELEINDTFELAAKLINLATKQNGINQATGILLTPTEDGQRVFEKLEPHATHLLMTSPNWDAIYAHMMNELPENEHAKLNDRFVERPSIDITRDMAAGLVYTAAEDGLGDSLQQPITAESLKQVLETTYGLQNILIHENPDDFRIIVAPEQNDHMTELFYDYNNMLHCTGAMIDLFYQAAVRIHGANSPRIIMINAELDPVTKLRALAEALQIQATITFPENAANPILDTDPAGFSKTLAILRYSTLPLEEKMRGFNAALDKLRLLAEKLDYNAAHSWRSYKTAADAANAMITNLENLGRRYFEDEAIPLTEFSQSCRNEVESKRGILAQHHGWSALLASFLKVVNALLYGITLTYVSNFFKMPAAPEAVRKIDDFKDSSNRDFQAEDVIPAPAMGM